MVSETILRIVAPCWRRPSVNGRCDGLLWYKNSGNHVAGEFSMSVIQAKNLLEDHSKLESGPVSMFDSGPHSQATFVGVYDGHGGPEAARFVNKHVFDNIRKFTSENHGMSASVMTKAFLATEEEFLSHGEAATQP